MTMGVGTERRRRPQVAGWIAALAGLGLAVSACTTTYTEADLPELDEQAAVQEKDDVARQKQLVQEGGLNNELLEDQERWLEGEATR